MNSKEFTALARKADDRGAVVAAFLEVPTVPTEGGAAWINDEVLTVAVMLEVPEYTEKGEPSYVITKAFMRRTSEPVYAVNPDEIRFTWNNSETPRLTRTAALAEFAVQGIRAL